MRRPTLNLLQRTSLTLALGFVLFAVFALVVVQLFVIRPVTERAAEELAALLEFSAKVWLELPPWTRRDYEAELRTRHGLRVAQTQTDLPSVTSAPEYLQHLTKSLSRQAGRLSPLLTDSTDPGWYWVDLPIGDRTLRLGFEQNRLRQRMPVALLLLGGAGALFILIISLLFVRHVTRPLARLRDAVRRLGRGETFDALPETGTTELVELAHRINDAEHEVRELLANRTTLLAGISHDLRTPISRMSLELELLEGQAAPDLLEQMRADLGEMDALISRTLELARGLERREADDALLVEVAAGLARSYERSGLHVNTAIPANCEIRVPPEVFQRVVGNLVDNASRYAGDKPVDLGILCADDHVLIRVRDRGPGIPSSERDAVTRPFHRLDTSRSRDTGGSGLGLAIVQQLCNAYGWHLSLNDAKGGGLEAKVSIPLD